jgi:hypothetical protein
MVKNNFLTAVCKNRNELAAHVASIIKEEKFVLIKVENESIILIGPTRPKHGRIVLEFMDQFQTNSVTVSGGGKCRVENGVFEFYGESVDLKSPKNEDMQAVLSVGTSSLKTTCDCYGDAKDTKYTHDTIRRVAL